ncbi:site-specific DNA-methyltransferase [Proteus penneri]|uniref:DNA-methyltransferase n=1 Tax=Proteus TaxID=583 RepID=UPI000D6DE22B|nr:MULTISPECIES: site-specific DNA-methyltransferase [Proteus]NBM97264.1 site-specific DNA-methyltransferase [Proteus sp. G2660]QPT34335.1 site-specific DNA-methyltransferase [Proteus penneri]
MQLYNNDALIVLKALPENCIDLIVTDPPYFRVKSCAWDNQWANEAEYLAWLDDVLTEFWRVLKPNGSLYLFCGSKLASDTELLVKGRFNMLSHIIWAKPSGPWRRQNKESLRAFFPSTERILFAEHYQRPVQAKGAEFVIKCRELKQQVFKPLMDYFIDARSALQVGVKQINKVTGKKMANHWFGRSQWQLPLRDDYQKLQMLFSQRATHIDQLSPLLRTYDDLLSEHKVSQIRYQVLVEEYGLSKRPFFVTADVPYTDVWTYPPVQYYSGKHPCEKPSAMMEHIIRSSSREGDLVADFFMGSGATLKAALKLNREVLGVELEKERFEQTEKEINNTLL